MSLSLSAQTVLQRRYRLLQLLAEGSFARTYLAEDQGRFGERCVVKEFCANTNDGTVFDKAKALFQREAQTLYQLQHPQVPQFRGFFAEEVAGQHRLFLVQDYVEGETYRSLLQQRSQTNQLFAEPEIRLLLAQLLPILDYIHGQGIIHRDLSPDNLMLRTADQLPVLIDFGVVKTVVTELQQTQAIPAGTVVGKFGYSPIEQLQSGRAYPSSDLYALAVCCLVLLTGLEPAQLFDDAAAVWQWRSHTTVSDGFAAILDKMLSHKPSDRYATADEVLQALHRAPPPNPGQKKSPLAETSVPPSNRPGPSLVGTIPLEQAKASPTQRPRRPKVIIPPVKKGSVTRRRPGSRPAPVFKNGALMAAGLVTAVLSAGAGWLLMQMLMLQNWTKAPSVPSPSVSPSPVETRSPEPTPSTTVRYSEALDLKPGQTATVAGTLNGGDERTYRFAGTVGNLLSAQLSGMDVTFTVLKSDLTAASPQSQDVLSWQGTLPQTGTYFVKIRNGASDTAQPFRLAIALAEAVPPEPVVMPSPSPSPPPSALETVLDETPLTLAPGAPDQSLNGRLAPAHVQRYTLPVNAGEVLSAAVAGNQGVTLTVRDPSGQAMSTGQKVLNWESQVSASGNYQIDVVPIDGTVPTDFAITIGLKAP
ncbi:MAG: serine/threonine-protein kinase [Thermosynechococcaceae cyanobacterium]